MLFIITNTDNNYNTYNYDASGCPGHCWMSGLDVDAIVCYFAWSFSVFALLLLFVWGRHERKTKVATAGLKDDPGFNLKAGLHYNWNYLVKKENLNRIILFMVRKGFYYIFLFFWTCYKERTKVKGEIRMPKLDWQPSRLTKIKRIKY